MGIMKQEVVGLMGKAEREAPPFLTWGRGTDCFGLRPCNDRDVARRRKRVKNEQEAESRE